MDKYYVDWDRLDQKDSGVLIDVVARYMSATEYPDLKVVMAILCINENESEE